MARVSTENGIATFELETPEGYQQFRRGLENERQWAGHAETNELLKFKSENCNASRIYVKYGEFSKQIK